MKYIYLLVLLLLMGCKTPIQKQDAILDNKIGQVKTSVQEQKKIISNIKDEAKSCNNELLNVKIDNLEKETEILDGRITELTFEKSLLMNLVEDELKTYKIYKKIFQFIILGFIIGLVIKNKKNVF